MKIYGSRLKELRKKHKIKQNQLAAYLFVSPSAVAYWESGLREPSMDIQKKIADYFGVTVDYMIRSDEEIRANNSWRNYFVYKFGKVV